LSPFSLVDFDMWGLSHIVTPFGFNILLAFDTYENEKEFIEEIEEKT